MFFFKAPRLILSLKTRSASILVTLMVTTISVESLDATWSEKMSTMSISAPGKTSGSRLDLLNTLPDIDRGKTETTMVVTQSRVGLPLFPGQPLDQPLHKPHIQVAQHALEPALNISHIQVTRHADEHFRDYQHYNIILSFLH